MKLLMLVFALAACYVPAVAGARGRGSRKLWIGLFFVGLCIAFAAIRMGGASSIWMSTPNAVSIMYEGIIRISIGIAFGSFLAAVLCTKRPVEKLKLRGNA